MDASQLKALQAPLKQRYRDDPESARFTLSASGMLGAEAITCRVETGSQLAEAGLHPATGGAGPSLTSASSAGAGRYKIRACTPQSPRAGRWC